MFKRLLIANRGEIACRIMRTARKLGITCIALYSEADRHSQHVIQADEAYCIGLAPSRESYLNISKILALAKQINIDAIHPGYGFLSENAEFVEACEQAGITFIGPSASAIKLMGSKSAAKRLMAEAGIPLLASYHESAQDLSTLQAAAKKIGYPVLLKATAGGGGRGMRIVNSAIEFAEQLVGAKREALASFGNDEMIIEKFLGKPRHVEVQIFADTQGNAVHLFTRDCSIQRRYQKVVEEAPAPNIPCEVREKLHQAAITVAQAIHYVGAGTIEFLFDNNQFYFMEMNTRLQVEHPVTEMITGFDLVEWQLRIAAGESLPVQQHEIMQQGHAIEVRLCAENPHQDFMPSAGRILFLQFPHINARVDTGIVAGDTVTSYYDPLLAKIIIHGDERLQAITHMQQALARTQIIGIHTNLALLRNIFAHPAFQQTELQTPFIAQYQHQLLQENQDIEATDWLAAALYIILQQQQDILQRTRYSPWQATDGWRLNTLPYQQFLQLSALEQTRHLAVRYAATDYFIDMAGQTYCVSGQLHKQKLAINAEGKLYHYQVIEAEKGFYLVNQIKALLVKPLYAEQQTDEHLEYSLLAPLPGAIVAVLVQSGEHVKKGQALLALEAMKMEHTIRAPHDGFVEAIYYQVGEQITEGAELLKLKEQGNDIT